MESLPVDKEESEDTFLPSLAHRITGIGDIKNAHIHLPDIGKFVAEIDDRTLNQYVFCWGEEKTRKELWDIARKVKLEETGALLKGTPKSQSKAQVLEDIRNAEDGSFARLGAEYMLSLYIKCNNTVDNAKKPAYGGALDARELYPHVNVTTVEEVAKFFHKQST